MEISIFLAKILSVMFIVIGIGLFFNRAHYQKAYTDMMKVPSVWFIAGLFSLVIGTIMVLVHNVWEWQWYVIITLFGWAGLLKGFLLLVFPKFAMKTSKGMLKGKGILLVAGIAAVILGVILGYYGFADCCEWLSTSLG